MANTPRKTRLNSVEFASNIDHLKIERFETGLVVVTLDYPDRRNAMSDPMTAAWVRLCSAIQTDDTVRAVVVTGEGKAFCSGGDLGWLGSEPDASVDALRTRMMGFYRAWLSMREVPVPVIAAINGPAVGAGACIALMADIRIAGGRAKFGVPFLQLCLHPGMATTYLLPEVVGVAAARDLLYTGRVIDAQRMLALGLVSEVVDDEQLGARARELGERVASNAPVATRLLKSAFRDGAMPTMDAAVQWEALAQPVTMATTDLQEGLVAAREKRAPHFTGS
ncbi:MAG: enoyl-CoA hydratase/isomerase family protein [Actinobacteria bacterium]|nr:enoyl-CoA hydratase/isomerase family protein [Actinomycetota bacterium]